MTDNNNTLLRLRRRAQMFAQIRAFFAERQVLEVDTPHLSTTTVSDPHIHSLRLQNGLYLNTSPEYAMKRLLSAGSGDIYQLAHVFRDEEQGRRHRREFMMLEWYRLNLDHLQLMEEVVALIRVLLPEKAELPVIIEDYDALFLRHCGFYPARTSSAKIAAHAAEVVPEALQWDLNRDGYLDLLFTHCIESQLGRNSWLFVCHYPPSQAALARLIPRHDHMVAARFELYHEGLELCNGFWELANADEQRRRFEQDNMMRQALHLPEIPSDELFLAALASGLPDCAGVALGIERLLMLAGAAESIDAILPLTNHT